MADFEKVSCKDPELRKDLVAAKMMGLEKRVVFNSSNIIPVKNEYGNYTISYNGIELKANIPEVNFKSAKELTSKIIQSYIDSGYKGNVYSYESLVSQVLPGKDKDSVMLLQVDNMPGPKILDSTLTYGDEFQRAFGFLPTRGNDLMNSYAIFVNEVIADVKKTYDDCNNSILNRDRLREADNTTPPKPETQTPQNPKIPKESGQTKLAGLSK